MAYGKRKKSSKVKGKSLINKMSKNVPSSPIIYETPTPPVEEITPPVEEITPPVEEYTPPAEILAPPVEEDVSNESITDDVPEPTLSVEEQQGQQRSFVNRLIRQAGKGKGKKRKKSKSS